MAKKKPAAAYHHGDLKMELMRQALPLIEESGLDGFTVRELARRVGVTHTAAYRHFSDRRELLVALACDGFESFAISLRRAVKPEDEIQTRILSAARAYFRWSSRNSAAYQVMFGPRLNEDDQYPLLEKRIESAFTAVDRAFLPESFSDAQAREYSVALMTQLHGYAEMTRLRRIRVKNSRVATTYLERLLRPFCLGVEAAASENSSL